MLLCFSVDSLAACLHRGYGALDPAPHYLQVYVSTQDQCCESVTFWLGSVSADPYPTTDPDPAFFVSG